MVALIDVFSMIWPARWRAGVGTCSLAMELEGLAEIGEVGPRPVFLRVWASRLADSLRPAALAPLRAPIGLAMAPAVAAAAAACGKRARTESAAAQATTTERTQWAASVLHFPARATRPLAI